MSAILFSVFHLVALIAIVLASYYVIAKRMGKLAACDFDAGSARPPRRAARVAEASILLAIGGVIWLLNSAYGRVFHASQINPALVHRNAIVAIVYGAGVVATAAMALWRTTPAVIFAVCLLSLHGFMMNFHDRDLDKKAAAPAEPGTLTIMPESSAKGVDVWVNGVYLGKTPATIPFKDLQEKLPPWDRPEETDDDFADVPEYRTSSARVNKVSRWMRLTVSHAHFTGDRQTRKQTHVFVKMRHGEDWGYSTGGYSGGGDERSMVYYMGVTFPDREKRIEKLLNLARLADYRPSPEWLRAIESYGDDGLLALRNAAAAEPRMMDAIDAWVNQRYGAVTDSDSAWRALEQIRRQAESQKMYSSAGLAGRAVERLAPRLDPHRLAALCCGLIREYGGINLIRWNAAGRPEFGYAEDGLNLAARTQTSSMSFSSGHGGMLPIGDFPIVHATAILFQQGKLETADRDRIAAEIVRRHYDNLSFMRLAVQLNAPSVEQFVLRQDWHEVTPPDWRDRILGRNDVNRWLDLAARLPGGAGRGFRHKNASLIMEMADKIRFSGIDFMDASRASDLDFLFVDDKYLARQYWPRFREKIAYNYLTNTWGYLACMDAPPDMFVQVLRDAKGREVELWEGTEVLNRYLKPEKCQAVGDALKEAVAREPDLIEPGPRDRLDRMRQDPQAQARELLAKLHEPGEESDKLHLYVGDWLAHKEPHHPLAALLARDADPHIRLLFLPVAEAAPTPEHRSLLNALVADKDATVSAAARAVAEKLTALGGVKPADLAARAAP